MPSISSGLPGFGVLQHRRPECAQRARDLVPRLRGLADVAADPRADRRGLLHRAHAEFANERIVEHAIGSRAGERRDRIHRQVAPQLVPDLLADVRGDLHRKSGVTEKLDQGREPRRFPPVDFADDQAIAERCARRRPAPASRRSRGRRTRSTWLAGIARPIDPPGSTLSSCMPAYGPGTPSKNHHGTPFIAGNTKVSGPISGAIDCATGGQRGALDGDHDEVLRPSSAASSDARAGRVRSASRWRSRQPCSRNAVSVAPRASALTSARPAAASFAPTRPPMAPTPTTQTFMIATLPPSADEPPAAAEVRSAMQLRVCHTVHPLREGNDSGSSCAAHARHGHTFPMQRKLTVILSADVVGYSGLMERDEAGTLERLKANRKAIFDPRVAAHGGRLVKLMGDGALVEFASVVAAVSCAHEIQLATEAESHARARAHPLPDRHQSRRGHRRGRRHLRRRRQRRGAAAGAGRAGRRRAVAHGARPGRGQGRRPRSTTSASTRSRTSRGPSTSSRCAPARRRAPSAASAAAAQRACRSACCRSPT